VAGGGVSDPIGEVFQAVEAADINGRPEENGAQPDSTLVERPVNSLPRSSWTARDLLQHDFPEPRYAVPGVLAEGLNLLAGAPKLGKSWFALNVAAAVAYGGMALDKITVERGEALYLALEDPPRRLQRRLRLILGGDSAPEGLFFETVWEHLLKGGGSASTRGSGRTLTAALPSSMCSRKCAASSTGT
jgi:hypothetical protein